MTFSPLAHRLRMCSLLTTMSLLVFAGVASGAATVEPFYHQEPISGTDVSSCTGLTGEITGTLTVAGQIVDTSKTFHVRGTATQDYRIDYTDGSYLLSQSPSHFDFNGNLGGQSVYTEVQQDRGTLYAANGEPIGNVTVFTLTHITARNGEITASVDGFRVTCP